MIWQGWCGSADPRKRQRGAKKEEVETMRRDMEEVRERREAEHLNLTSSDGLELVPLMKNQVTIFKKSSLAFCAGDRAASEGPSHRVIPTLQEDHLLLIIRLPLHPILHLLLHHAGT